MPKRLKMKYFVLSPFSKDPEHKRASIAAVEAYARYIRRSNSDLADDLFIWIYEEGGYDTENSPE